METFLWGDTHRKANALRSLFQSGKCYEDSEAGRCVQERLGVTLDRVRTKAPAMGRPGEPDVGRGVTNSKTVGRDSCGSSDAHNNGQCP